MDATYHVTKGLDADANIGILLAWRKVDDHYVLWWRIPLTFDMPLKEFLSTTI